MFAFFNMPKLSLTHMPVTVINKTYVLRRLVCKVNLNFDASFRVFSAISTATYAFVGHKYRRTCQLLWADKTPGENGLFTINSKSTLLPSVTPTYALLRATITQNSLFFKRYTHCKLLCVCFFSTFNRKHIAAAIAS